MVRFRYMCNTCGDLSCFLGFLLLARLPPLNASHTFLFEKRISPRLRLSPLDLLNACSKIVISISVGQSNGLFGGSLESRRSKLAFLLLMFVADHSGETFDCVSSARCRQECAWRSNHLRFGDRGAASLFALRCSSSLIKLLVLCEGRLSDGNLWTN